MTASAKSTSTIGSAPRPIPVSIVFDIRIRPPAPEREETARALLDEEDDEDQNQDLGEHRASIGLKELVRDAERQRAGKRPPEIADAAEHDDHEAVDDVALAEVRRHVVDLRKRYARHAGDSGAEREGEGVDPGRADSHRRGHAAVLRHRPHLQAEGRRLQDHVQDDEDQKRKDDDPHAVVGDRQMPDVEGAGHPRRISDLPVVGAEDRADRLLQDQATGPTSRAASRAAARRASG